MRGIDETFQRMLVPIHMGGSKKIHPVVAPIPTTGKLSQRHQLDHGDTACLQFIELADGSVERPLSGKRSNVQFVDDLSRYADAGPSSRAPLIGLRIHD